MLAVLLGPAPFAAAALVVPDPTTDDVAAMFIHPDAWACRPSDGCVECANVGDTASTIRMVGAAPPREDVSVDPGAIIRICPP